MTGPLDGVRIVELAGLGPAPFAAMVLADLGADIVRVDRAAGRSGFARFDVLNRGRRSIAVDLKHPDGVEVVLRLAAEADALIEGFRPGVTERLGVGPEACLDRNPHLVYGRMTGWGQEGPYAAEAGHDIAYAAVAGALAHIGRAGQPPTPPLNLVADFGGGGMVLALGVVSGVLSARQTGRGQVVDAAMVDGVALLMAPFFMALRTGYFTDERGTEPARLGRPVLRQLRLRRRALRGGGGAGGAVLRGAGRRAGHRRRRAGGPARQGGVAGDACAVRRRVRDPDPRRVGRPLRRARRLRRPREHQRGDAGRPAPRGRGTVVDDDGVVQPSPAPRFSGTPAEVDRPAPEAGEHTDEVLAGAGYAPEAVAALRASGAVA